MAKNKCPHCGAKFDGPVCPNCKTPASESPKKKKTWMIPAAVILILLALVSCMSSNDSPSGEPSDPTEQTQPPVSTNSPETHPETAPSATAAVTLSETEIYNTEGITVTVKKLENSLLGPELTVTVGNDSEKNVIVTTQQLSVNGFMIDTSALYAQVAAGKKANEVIYFYSSDLDKMGIESIADVEFYIQVMDSDTYQEIAYSELIRVSTSASGTYEQAVDDSGEEIFSGSGIRVISKGLQKDLLWEGTLVFFLENNSGFPITVYAENVSVNGFMVDQGLWSDLRNGTVALDGMYLLNLEDLDITDISQIEELEFTLRIINSKTWEEIASSDVITLTMK